MKELPTFESAAFLFENQYCRLYLVASAKGLQSIGWKKPVKIKLQTSLNGISPEIKLLKEAVRQLNDFFLEKRISFDLPLDTKGTVFQKQVWKELSLIPYGQTRSYRDIARKLKNEKAVRAVGNANSRNPVCIVVPCHRVISSDGSLGGYSGGLKLKKQLLTLESPNRMN